jgi:hypothetical protein
MRQRGFEPPRYCYRQPLKLVRLPVPPLPLADILSRLVATRHAFVASSAARDSSKRYGVSNRCIGFAGCGKSQRGTGFRSTATLGCVVFAALNKGAQPRVAVLPGFFHSLFGLLSEKIGYQESSRTVLWCRLLIRRGTRTRAANAPLHA